MAENTKEDDITFPKHLWDKESKELRTAIYDDWKRKAINDAKFRAVEQHVDYPTFANLVRIWNSRRCDPTRKILVVSARNLCEGSRICVSVTEH